MVEGIAIGGASLRPRRTPRAAIGDPIAQAAWSHRAEKRGGYFARKPAGQLRPLISHETFPTALLHGYPGAILERLEPQRYRCYARGLPISRMPFEGDFLR